VSRNKVGRHANMCRTTLEPRYLLPKLPTYQFVGQSIVPFLAHADSSSCTPRLPGRYVAWRSSGFPENSLPHLTMSVQYFTAVLHSLRLVSHLFTHAGLKECHVAKDTAISQPTNYLSLSHSSRMLHNTLL